MQTTSDTTIAPPEPKPADTGTDAMTQTVEVEGSREAEGGVLTSSSTTASSTVEKKTTTSKSRPPGRKH